MRPSPAPVTALLERPRAGGGCLFPLRSGVHGLDGMGSGNPVCLRDGLPGSWVARCNHRLLRAPASTSHLTCATERGCLTSPPGNRPGLRCQMRRALPRVLGARNSRVIEGLGLDSQDSPRIGIEDAPRAVRMSFANAGSIQAATTLRRSSLPMKLHRLLQDDMLRLAQAHRRARCWSCALAAADRSGDRLGMKASDGTVIEGAADDQRAAASERPGLSAASRLASLPAAPPCAAGARRP